MRIQTPSSGISGSGEVIIQEKDSDLCQNKTYWSHFGPRKHIESQNLEGSLLLKVLTPCTTTPENELT